MAVKVYCSICEATIEIASGDSLKKLTGKEICKDCGNKISVFFADLENIKKKCMVDLQVLYEKAKKEFRMLDQIFDRYNSDTISLFKNANAELEDTLKYVKR